jgi:hypothetical protein
MHRLARLSLVVTLGGCSMPNPEFDPYLGIGDASEVTGDGDPTTGDGDPGDGDPGDGDPGDGDGDPGDGDGDGDGDPGDGDPGDGDGDGDSGDGDGDGDEQCGAPMAYADCDLANGFLTTDPFAALGLDCEGPLDQTIPLVSKLAAVANPASMRVAKRFGSSPGPNHDNYLWAARSDVISPGDGLPDITPNTSAAILIMSTGLLPWVGNMGEVVVPASSQANSGENNNPSGGELPAPISAWHGSNNGDGGTPFLDCDGINDCSDSLHEQWFGLGLTELFNKQWLQFEATVPPGVHGYVFDFAFFTSEYPSFVDTMYNDMFVAWSSSDAYTGNLTFIGQAPMNTNSLAASDGFAHIGQDPALIGTGFELNGSTEWLLARGPASPGEQIQVTLFVSDLGDSLFGSVVLLDNFRWDCGGCQGADCGFNP